ncbi:unnamed protein product [Gongylonema pulchrum]|uniref:Uncharacterized protein n=1 Tax=Gongylonema pulchrum TaxID=637853 RepID=A0A183DH82_9BILA|nr:unnamed protein product [Gongylonema pulchrum]
MLSVYLPQLRPYATVRPSPRRSFLNGWWMSSLKLFSCCERKNSSRNEDRRRSSQFTGNDQERVLRANDREFNEQFKYAVCPHS